MIRNVVPAVLTLAVIAGSAQAQTWPTRPLRMIVGFPPGQATDLIARAVADKMSSALGQQVIVDNRPGAAGIIGTEAAMKAAPDGYTLLMTSSGPFAINPGLYAKLPYDPVRDFTAVSLAAIVPQFLVAHPSFAPNTVAELVALAKAKPGTINYASGGSGLTNHLLMEMLKGATGIDIVHVPYKGGPPAVADLIAGQVSLMFETGIGVLPHVRSGKLKAIATSIGKRSAAMPDLPTIAEQGVSGFEGAAWVGLVGPAGLPAAVVSRLHAETVKAVGASDVRERFFSLGTEPAGTTPEQFASFIRSEVARWGKTIRDSGAKVD